VLPLSQFSWFHLLNFLFLPFHDERHTTPNLLQMNPGQRIRTGAHQLWGPEPFGVLAPGLGLLAACAALAYGVHELFASLSVLTAAVIIGVTLTNTGRIPGICFAGIQWGGRKLLRVGVVLLGLRLTLNEMGDLGIKGLALVVSVVALTFFGTQWFARRLGLTPALGLLVATGFSICGASAVAAMKGVTPEAKQEDVVYSVALVTLCGSLAIAVLPIVGPWLGFEGHALGSWIGASVHDVAQTIATASAAGGGEVSEAATVVKLTRVVLLAPMVIGVSLWRRAHDPSELGSRPPLLPLFVACFLVAIVLRSTGWLSSDVLNGAKTIETLLFAAALVSLGIGVRFDRLRRLGVRPLILGLASWALVAGISATGVKLLDI
jgi:uncharacterized integral membrane protein (TIGR00698 family)